MTKKARDLITSLTQMWVAYGACKNESRAEEIKVSAEKSIDALIQYIEKLEGSREIRSEVRGAIGVFVCDVSLSGGHASDVKAPWNEDIGAYETDCDYCNKRIYRRSYEHRWYHVESPSTGLKLEKA